MSSNGGYCLTRNESGGGNGNVWMSWFWLAISIHRHDPDVNDCFVWSTPFFLFIIWSTLSFAISTISVFSLNYKIKLRVAAAPHQSGSKRILNHADHRNVRLIYCIFLMKKVKRLEISRVYLKNSHSNLRVGDSILAMYHLAGAILWDLDISRTSNGSNILE